jgi:multicomponent Na+:H+ antiporter subunit A
MLIPSAILASGTILFAFFANPLAQALLIPAANSVTGTANTIYIKFWHGFNMPLAMTVIVFVLGIIIYRKLDATAALFRRLPTLLSFNHIYDRLIRDNALVNCASRITNFYMTGRLYSYIRFICIFFIFITFSVMMFKGALVLDFSDNSPLSIYSIIWALAIVAAALILIKSNNRIVLLFSLGVIGYTVAFFFVIFGAPDLALTMLLVETVMLVLFYLAYKHLPYDGGEKQISKPNKVINAVISCVIGATVTIIALIGHGNKLFAPISDFYIENSKTLGGGNNIVNILLVDFRALDTLGEITVIAIAVIGVFVLLSHFNKEHLGIKEKTRNPNLTPEQLNRFFGDHDEIFRRKKLGSNIIMNTLLGPLSFFVVIFSFYLFWNGHNLPGGGFAAGLMMASAVMLLYVNYGSSFATKRMKIDFKYLLAAGLAFSMCTGLGAILFGYPFLSHAFGSIYLPFLGETMFYTSSIFDLGVFLTVTGGCLTIIIDIGQSGAEINILSYKRKNQRPEQKSKEQEKWKH